MRILFMDRTCKTLLRINRDGLTDISIPLFDCSHGLSERLLSWKEVTAYRGHLPSQSSRSLSKRQNYYFRRVVRLRYLRSQSACATGIDSGRSIACQDASGWASEDGGASWWPWAAVAERTAAGQDLQVGRPLAREEN